MKVRNQMEAITNKQKMEMEIQRRRERETKRVRTTRSKMPEVNACIQAPKLFS